MVSVTGSLSRTATTGVHVRLRPFGNGPAALHARHRVRRIGFVTPDSARLSAVTIVSVQVSRLVLPGLNEGHPSSLVPDARSSGCAWHHPSVPGASTGWRPRPVTAVQPLSGVR